ncbi:MAG: type IV pilin N-terminal domain-containing protein [Thermoplasmata archaeon]|nr:type IV pilin N-terminal domain-containing protein [Thermoplasmata archaeon]MCI4359741.1 type IV pilin N-terminal domain-containing protein [Thermoplasmata archaeon]
MDTRARHRCSIDGPLFHCHGARRRPRGVSSIVATMLLLAITVILFSAIFIFIGRIPKPGPQPLDQFDASLSYSGTTVSRISILHLSGSTLSGPTTSQAGVYIVSQKHPVAIPNPFTLAAGLSGSTVWTFGQTWTINMTSYAITASDNLTVSVISAGQLQFRSTLAVSVATFAPYFGPIVVTPTGVIPAAHAYTVNASAYFATLSGDSVKINTTEFPGGAVTTMAGSGGSGYYTFSGTTPSPASQTSYYLFLTATDGNNLRTVLAIIVTVA